MQEEWKKQILRAQFYQKRKHPDQDEQEEASTPPLFSERITRYTTLIYNIKIIYYICFQVIAIARGWESQILSSYSKECSWAMATNTKYIQPLTSSATSLFRLPGTARGRGRRGGERAAALAMILGSPLAARTPAASPSCGRSPPLAGSAEMVKPSGGFYWPHS